MKYIIAFLLSTAIAFAATGDVQVKQKQASGAWKEVVIPATNSTLIGFNGSGVVGPASSVTALDVGTITLTTNTLPLPPGTVSMWDTADIANKPTNTLVCDGANGTVNVTAPTGLTAIVVGNGTLTTPTVDVGAGTYTSAQSVSVTNAVVGATDRYTLTGVDPIASDTAVSGAISVASSATLKIKRFRSLWTPSTVFSAAYTINAVTGFSWGMESTTATGTGDTSAALTGATLSSAWAHAGTQSLFCSGAAWQYAEFTTVATANPDYNWAEGTAILRIRWSGTWTNGAYALVLSSNSGSGRILLSPTSTQGQISLSYRGSNNSSATVNVSGLTNPDTTYLVTAKWRYASSPYLSIDIDGGTPSTNTTGLSAISEDTAKIHVGNYSAVAGVSIYIDELNIYPTWQ